MPDQLRMEFLFRFLQAVTPGNSRMQVVGSTFLMTILLLSWMHHNPVDTGRPARVSVHTGSHNSRERAPRPRLLPRTQLLLCLCS